jgi:5-methylcytosine-specific restriction endonuclease McrA
MVHLVSETYIPAAIRRAVETRDGDRCAYCGNLGATTLDHVVSELDGGPTVETNLVVCCADCNSRKGCIDADLFAQYLERRGKGRVSVILERIRLRLEASR